MRINKFVAAATGLSRRKADELILRSSVTVNGQPAAQGQDVTSIDVVKLGNNVIEVPTATTTIMLNKPVGYVVSRDGQGSQTIYDLLPPEYQTLKPIGRLDKNSSGLLLLTNDGNLANNLTHPSHQKQKVYEITLYKPLSAKDYDAITKSGVNIGDNKPSRFAIEQLETDDLQPATGNRETPHISSLSAPSSQLQITMSEGRNRQIRRTFAALNYEVKTLHRTQFGDYRLGNLPFGLFKIIA